MGFSTLSGFVIVEFRVSTMGRWSLTSDWSTVDDSMREKSLQKKLSISVFEPVFILVGMEIDGKKPEEIIVWRKQELTF